MKKYRKIACLVICIGLVFASCKKKDIERDLRQLLGTVVVIPYGEMVSKGNNDLMPIPKDYTYVVYYDSLVCSTCTLKNLYYWEVLNDSISKLEKNAHIVFIFSPPKDETIQFLYDLSNIKMELTALVDTSGCFIKRNKQIPNNPNTHAFLLDKDSKVIMVGDANRNPLIEELLFKTISNDIH